MLYAQKCEVCHGVDGVVHDDDVAVDYPLDVSKFTLASLTSKIDIDMPKGIGEPADCVGQCAADIAAYVITWERSDGFTCETENPVTYSPRQLRILTVDEYQNTLEDLLNVDRDYRTEILTDGRKGTFPNNSSANVDEPRANKYWNVAEKVAAWAVENGQPFVCDVNTDCASIFMDDFAYRAFRRPLTNAEITTFENIFSEYPGEAGLEVALTSVLNSPQFLYRSEMGRKVADVLNGEGIEPRYIAADPITIIAPEDFASGPVENGFAQISLYGNAGKTISNYTFTGDDILKIKVRGTFADGAWPTLSLKIANQEIATQPVDFGSTRTLTFRLEGIVGNNQYMQIENKNSGAHSQSRDLYLGEMVFGRAELELPSKGDEEKLAMADPNAYVLTPYELATYLSYTLTGSTPDADLLEAAATGGLDYADQIRAHVQRLLDTDAGRRQMGVFAGYWFNTDRVVLPDFNRDTAVFPGYTENVRNAMAEEVRQLFRVVFYNESGAHPFETFYNGDFTVLNKTLADFYGISAGSTGDNDWRMVDSLDKRGGILTTGAFMTVNAHSDKTAPIIRAVRVREQMLCQHIDPPPLLVEDRQHLLEQAEAEYKQGIATSRSYYEIITNSPACDGCHQYQINPMFGMEDFDQVGQWRDTQKGSTGMTLDIDSSGFLYGPENVTDTSTRIPFEGAKGLSKVLGDLPGTHECLIQKSFRYAIGMPISNKAVDKNAESELTPQQQNDFACAANTAQQAFEAAGRSPRAVMTELVMQDFVRFRN